MIRLLACLSLLAVACGSDEPSEIQRIDGPAQVDEDRLTTGGAENQGSTGG